MSSATLFLAISEVILMANVWKIAPGERAFEWEMCRQKGCILLGWLRLKDYRTFKSEKQIIEELGGGPGEGAGAAKSIWRFAHDIQPNDVVIANKGRCSILGIGIVKSEYLPPKSSKNPSSEYLPHARLVDWVIVQTINFDKYFFSPPTIHSLTAERVDQIKKAYLKKYPKMKEKLDQLFDSVFATDDIDDSATNKLLEKAEQKLKNQGAFDPAGIKDARERILLSIKLRRGQSAFRNRLLVAYKGRCAITGCDLKAVLEASHIVPYMGPKTNHSGNGLLLRTDLHTLFDLRLVAVDAATMRLIVSPKLAGTDYENYHGKKIEVPDDPANQPSRDALEQHRRNAVWDTGARRRTRRRTLQGPPY